MDLKELWLLDSTPVVAALLVDDLAIVMVLCGLGSKYVVSSCNKR